ncbi:MAG: hypothetical protein Q8O52_21985 [Sulfuritalea sp.]|nr:hypothetical protein [Sulfuritalea sp.]
MSATQSNHQLADFLAPGVIAEDVPGLHTLIAAQSLIGVFVALFRGGDEEVLVRLAVLREIGARAEAPLWSPRELEARFVWLDPVKLDTVLKRLREHGLLVWDGDTRLYSLAPAGRMALAALDQMLRFAADEDAELGFLVSQVAAGSAVGRLSADNLRHLLARLWELKEEFSAAVASGSEFRLKAAQGKLESVWQWMEKGTQVLGALSEEGFDDDTWRLAQEIGARQSEIMRMSSIFQRELTAIARQRVHLSDGGLTTSEVAGWLRAQSLDELAALSETGLTPVPEPLFILPDVMLDIAEAELVDKQRADRHVSTLPPPMPAEPMADATLAPPPEFADLLRLLGQVETPLTVADAVVGGSFRAASYRLSLLPFLGETNVDPDMAPLAGLPLVMEWDADTTLVLVGREEVAAITSGRLQPANAEA